MRSGGLLWRDVRRGGGLVGEDRRKRAGERGTSESSASDSGLLDGFGVLIGVWKSSSWASESLSSGIDAAVKSWWWNMEDGSEFIGRNTGA